MKNKTIRLFLARHGNTFNASDKVVTVGAHMDLPLTEFGHQQALALSEYFSKNNIIFDKVYCGKLTRQKQTAQAVCKTVIENIAALDELDYGPWEGLTDDEIKSQWPSEFHDWSESGIWPSAIFKMSFEQKQAMIRNWLEGLDFNEETILAVSSGGTIRLFLSLIPEIWKNINFRSYKIKTGHLCALLITPQTLEMLSWNQEPI